MEVEGTGGVVQTSTNFAEYRITAMEEITALPDAVHADALIIRRTDWKVSDNVTGSMAESMVFDSARRKVCFVVWSLMSERAIHLSQYTIWLSNKHVFHLSRMVSMNSTLRDSMFQKLIVRELQLAMNTIRRSEENNCVFGYVHSLCVLCILWPDIKTYCCPLASRFFTALSFFWGTVRESLLEQQWIHFFWRRRG